ncbi:MAG: superoxide dismutase [Pseudomonadota bacterium]
MTFTTRRNLLLGTAALAASPLVGRRVVFAQDGPHSQAPLGYAFDALEPHIDALTMELHYGKHHAGYVRGLNDALADHGQAAELSITELLARLRELPEEIRTAVRNNGGGHANHSMFWSVMSAEPGEASSALREAIDRDFGSVEELKSDFETAGLGRFGSGWVFVTVDGDGRLAITTTPNQDTPLMDGGRVLFGNDVWEHAYYLTYQNRRGDYLDAWWNVLDWAEVSRRYEAAKAGTLDI